MHRRDFIHFIASSAAAWPLAARAQQASRTYRIAYLALAGTNDVTIVKERLKELGYEEGKNLIFDLRSAHGELDALPKVAADLVETNPDVIIPASERRPPKRRRRPPRPYLSFSAMSAIRSDQASFKA